VSDSRDHAIVESDRQGAARQRFLFAEAVAAADIPPGVLNVALGGRELG
jgi:hypothetical protein